MQRERGRERQGEKHQHVMSARLSCLDQLAMSDSSRSLFIAPLGRCLYAVGPKDTHKDRHTLTNNMEAATAQRRI